ncbi:MAG TPA: dihydrofolate reductase family protein [Stackebrandtia sp.]|jgi:dihydrofolate reductase|uniref:dihydrofolate reductase family protein n=1 Tax=Stackebrandtia sp. TaxID=2023065 RepID=UPI002D32A191|nr:dihydrofolate reductase family protein [Stackebrandtia sp.]HZE39237.1 dihydrofolate reductase family protein [Stackebrandtia sp.]
MRKLVYSFGVSLDGYIDGPNRSLDWSTPGAELHRFYNGQAADTGVELYGRRLYELMYAFWPTAHLDPDASEEVLEFARVWRSTPKLVYSSTLSDVADGATLMREDPVDTVARLKAESGKDIAVGGAGLAAGLIRAGLVDEFRMVVFPVILGGGTPYFPKLEAPLRLREAETREFPGGERYLRYVRAD